MRSKAVASSSLAGGDPTDTQVRRATATLELNGEQLPLAPPGIVIGRGNDADLRIDDPGVSRQHIEIRVEEAQDLGGRRGSRVHDLGSTNGMLGQRQARRAGHARRRCDDPDRQHDHVPAPQTRVS